MRYICDCTVVINFTNFNVIADSENDAIYEVRKKIAAKLKDEFDIKRVLLKTKYSAFCEIDD